MTTAPERTYFPAAGHDWFLPFYDPLLKLLGATAAQRELLEQAVLQPGQRVLDIGCGTGSLAILIKPFHPEVEVLGLDPDPNALARGRRKAERAGFTVQFDRGFSDELPYPDASFDRVFSSFMFHHLRSNEKKKTLHEVRRVLRPGSSVHLLDFGGPNSRRDGFLARTLHPTSGLKENFEGRIVTLMREAGFADPKEVSHRAMIFGRVAYYRASVPTKL